MDILKNLFLPILVLCLTSCSFVKVRETKDTKNKFQTALKSSNQALKKVKKDFRVKTQIHRHVRDHSEPVNQSVISNLDQNIETMKNQVEVLQKQNSKLSDLNGQFSAIAHNKKELRSSHENWSQSEAIIDEFKTTTESLNQEFEKYSTASNQYASSVSEAKLFFQIKRSEVSKKMKKSFKMGRKQHKIIKTDLIKKQKRVSKLESNELLEKNPKLEIIMNDFESLKSNEKTVFDSVNQLKGVLEKFEKDFAKKKLIKSSDKKWENFLELKGQYDQQINAISKARKNYQKTSEKLSIGFQGLR